MDRLSALSGRAAAPLVAALAVAVAVGCDGGEAAEAAPAPSGRVVAVAAPAPAADLDAFCDARPDGSLAEALATVPGGRDAVAAGRPTWLNVWATWCEPCKEELPFVLSLEARLGPDGPPARHALRFLSVDGDDATVAAWRAEHPEMPPSLRVDPGERFDAVLAAFGLRAGSAIPVHAFADSSGRVRCVRQGKVERHHLPTLRALLGG